MNNFTLPTGTTNRHQWHKPTLAAINGLDRLRFMRRELYGVKGEVVELPEGSFKESGTGINAVLLVVDKE